MGNETSTQAEGQVHGRTNSQDSAGWNLLSLGQEQAMQSFDERGAGLEVAETLEPGPFASPGRPESATSLNDHDAAAEAGDDEQDDPDACYKTDDKPKRFVWTDLESKMPVIDMSAATLQSRRAPPAEALSRKIEKTSAYALAQGSKTKSVVAKLQKKERDRAFAMQCQAIERELNGPAYAQTHKDSVDKRRIKAAVSEARAISYNVYEYTTFSSSQFAGYDQFMARRAKTG